MQALVKRSYGLLLFALLISGVELFAWFYLHRTGYIEILIASDRSYVSVVILSIYALATLYFLYITYLTSRYFNAVAAGTRAHSATPPLHEFFRRLDERTSDLERCSTLVEVLDTRIRSTYAFGFIIADLMLKLGILGTVIGFIFMLGSLSNLNSIDITVMQTLLAEMSSGMKVALFTTLCGLLAGIALNIKYNLVDWAVDLLINDIREIAVSQRPMDRPA